MGSKRAKIVACKALPNYRIWIRFDDGLEGEVDLNHLALMMLDAEPWWSDDT